MKPAASHTLNVLGLLCPQPIIKTAKRVKKMSPGDVLEVLSDDPVIEIDMPAWCHTSGHEYLGCDPRNGQFHVYVRVNARAGSP